MNDPTRDFDEESKKLDEIDRRIEHIKTKLAGIIELDRILRVVEARAMILAAREHERFTLNASPVEFPNHLRRMAADLCQKSKS